MIPAFCAVIFEFTTTAGGTLRSRMPKSEKRVKITLECTECKHRNYITMKSKINDRERLEMKKYCSHDRRHTVHKETR